MFAYTILRYKVPKSYCLRLEGVFKSDDVSSESVPSGFFDAEILPTASLEEYPRSEQPDRAGSIRGGTGVDQGLTSTQLLFEIRVNRANRKPRRVVKY